MEEKIKKSKNGNLYITKKDFNEFAKSAVLKNINNIDGFDYIVVNNNYYYLFNKGDYYTIGGKKPFINLIQYQYLIKEYDEILQDIKENKNFYENEELYNLKGKLHYIAELINSARHQLINLKILK